MYNRVHSHGDFVRRALVDMLDEIGREATGSASGYTQRHVRKMSTPSLEEVLTCLRQHRRELDERFRLKSLSVFGSYVRRQQGKSSDLDLLVEFEEPPTLLEFLRLEQRLCDLLGTKVDLVMKEALKPTIGRRILEEAVPV